ncbi:MAG: MiaB/RimO family radical SAM methylthiotransferase [Patescibacteria group bacterium]|nr:MiaB/RimO family radical SAM methylthiotransferase [Patescibacteria group bacterium]
MKYFIKIYGCQYNVWDAARIDFMLKKIGLMPSNEKEAEIIFILSCSVRKSAVDRIMGMVKNWQSKKVVVTGCVIPNDKPKYLKKNVILWDSKKPEDLSSVLFEDEKSENFSLRRAYRQAGSKNIETMILEGNSSSAYLPIMIGCNNFCSYCAVPYTRGREESRPFDEIVSDFKKLVDKGYKEIMLLGQNVNSYKYDFALLLKTLNDVPGDFVIRFTSNHPKDMTDDIIEAVRDLPKVKKEIHLPLQSGSNKILKAMNRPYTKEKYLDIIDKIKKEIPNIELLTDAIVGFPGETEEDFQETVEVFNKIGYHQAFVNKYSPRSGTAAFKLGDPILWKEKQRRWKILNDMANKN